MYYLAKTIGTGNDKDSFRPKVADYKCSYSAVYSSPNAEISIVAVKAESDIITQINADPDITFLGDNLDEAMTSEEFQRICPDGQVMVYG